ncbi:hypothetical protein AOQ84DRAFT_375053 [Glonium stellatum]|uniref:Uncharacterized protein n=1 Tax=Glonium stellatum TaxID=574774 RepID=A0A8E2F4A8_9PEZI|nr:hypothetical protein AOQ84DRAFT_375053 [Glonium stellatum]
MDPYTTPTLSAGILGGPKVDPLRESRGTDDMPQLINRIEMLERETLRLFRLNQDLSAGQGRSSTPPYWQIFYRFSGSSFVYPGPPKWTVERGIADYKEKMYTLKGNTPIVDPEQYFQRREDLAFAVYKTYSP